MPKEISFTYGGYVYGVSCSFNSILKYTKREGRYVEEITVDQFKAAKRDWIAYQRSKGINVDTRHWTKVLGYQPQVHQ